MAETTHAALQFQIESLEAHANQLRALEYRAHQMRNAPQAGRLGRELEATWAKIDNLRRQARKAS